jgi:hypothetical protein
MSIALKNANLSKREIGGMNRNLLNIERQFRKDGAHNGRLPEISIDKPLLRFLARAVREEFLKSEATTFKDDNLRSRLKEIGSGAAHTVSKGSYTVGGEAQFRVHKGDDEVLVHPNGGRFGAPSKLKLDQTNPRLLERSVFTAKLDKELGFNVCVGTDFATHHDQIGLVMELAQGTTAADAYVVEDNPARAQKELLKLQLLDILTGQADRHHSNYMVQTNEQGQVLGVKGIDSDFCMGPEPHDILGIVGENAVHLPGLPPVVDTEMALAVRRLTPEKLQELCGDFFDDDTIEAAKSRLTQLKSHIDVLETRECVIPPDQWGSDEVTKLLKETKDGRGNNTSYWQRDYPEMTTVFYLREGGGFGF